MLKKTFFCVGILLAPILFLSAKTEAMFTAPSEFVIVVGGGVGYYENITMARGHLYASADLVDAYCAPWEIGVASTFSMFDVEAYLNVYSVGYSLRDTSRAANDLDAEARGEIVEAINTVLARPEVFGESGWQRANLNGEAHGILEKGTEHLTVREVQRLNRLVLESVFPGSVARSTRNLHTKVEVPGLKNVLLPMGAFYVLFVMVHMYLVFYHDYVEGRGTTSSMVGGWKFERKELLDS